MWRFSAIFIILCVISGLVVSSEAIEVKQVNFTTSSGKSMEALFASPEGKSNVKAVIYNHGLQVQKNGYKGAVSLGYDVADFVKALVKSGYACIAPLRSDNLTPADEVMKGAISFLKTNKNISTDKIGMIGFSIGGVVTFKAALKINELAALILMSPSVRGPRDNPQLVEMYDNLSKIKAPIMVTLGKTDNPRYIKHINEVMIPEFKKNGHKYVAKLDYPGGHTWFWKIHDTYWKDIDTFLKNNLK